MRKRVFWGFGAVVLTLVLGACAPHASQDTLKPQGTYAREIYVLFKAVFWVAVAGAAILVYLILR